MPSIEKTCPHSGVRTPPVSSVGVFTFDLFHMIFLVDYVLIL